MRKHITRRQALNRGGMALAVTGATATLGFPLLAKADDAELLARVAVFWKAYEESNRVHGLHYSRRGAIEAMPDYPELVAPAFDREGYERHTAFMKRHGDMWEVANKAGEQMGKATNAVFATTAQTVRGAYEKLRIARLATGATAEGGDGDAGLSCYQDFDAPWIDSALSDLERLAGGAA